jgi:hypothetical protein
MNYSLRYSSTRAEIFRWYYRSWKKDLCRIHFFVAVAVGVEFILSESSFSSLQPITWFTFTLAIFPVVVIIFAAYPQIMFKPHERILIVGPESWSSQVGNKSGSKCWTEVASVDTNKDNAVIITSKNGNALVVPVRAFESIAQQKQFTMDVCLWLKTKHL